MTHFEVLCRVVKEIPREELEALALAGVMTVEHVVEVFEVDGVRFTLPSECPPDLVDKIGEAPFLFRERCRALEALLN